MALLSSSTVGTKRGTFQNYLKKPVLAQPRKRDIILNNVEDVIHYVDWVKRIVDPTVPFWRDLFDEYDRYFEKHGGIITADSSAIWASPEITELAAHAACIKHFECCWARDKKTKSAFVSKLVNQPESTLFEILIALQYCFAGYRVGLIPEFKGETTPDIVVSHPHGYVLVECMSKKRNRQREDIIDKLIWDLTVGGIYKKMKKQIRDWGFPLILAINVPEQINWADKSFKMELERAMKDVYTKYQPDYRTISFVIFSSGFNPSQDVNSKGEFQPDKLICGFRNPSPKYEIPPDFKAHGALSEKEREQLNAQR